MAAPISHAISLPPQAQSGQVAQVRVRAVDPITNLDEDRGGRFFLLSVQNPCELDLTGQICVPVQQDHPLYRSEGLLDNPVCCIESLDRGDGSYDLYVTLQKKGMFSLTVQSLELGGLVGQYWDNQWFFGSPIETRQDGTVDFQWGGNALAG